MDLFKKNISREEFRDFQPSSENNFNKPSYKTEFYIDLGDTLFTSGFEYYISGEIKQIDDKDYKNDSDVKLIDNFVPHLFTSIEVKKHNTVIDQVDFPGITSTVKQYVSETDKNIGYKLASGLKSQFTSGGGKFYAMGKLSDFGLGFFETYNNFNLPIYVGDFNISFARNNDDDALLISETKDKDGVVKKPSKGKIIIKQFYIRVPIIEYEPETKAEIVNYLINLSKQKALILNYKKWTTIQIKGVSSNSLSANLTYMHNNNSPIFIMVVFQKNLFLNQEKDLSNFENCDVQSISVKIDDEVYPKEELKLDFENKDYLLAYRMFKDYKERCLDGPDMTLSPEEFCKNKTIFVIDTSKQPLKLNPTKPNISLNVKFRKQISAPTNGQDGCVCHIILISNKSIEYDIFNRIVTTVN